MKFKKFISLFRESLRDLIKNPILVIPTSIIWIFMILFSLISVKTNHHLTTTPTITIWFALFAIISLLVASFFLSAIIEGSSETEKSRPNLKKMFSAGRKYILPNFVIIVIIIILLRAVFLLATYLALLIGESLSLPLHAAQALFFIIAFIGIAGFLIFFLFSSFHLVIEKKSIYKSIRSSFSLVKKVYPYAFSITILFFIITTLLGYIPATADDAITSIIVTPYFILLLTKLFLNSKSK